MSLAFALIDVEVSVEHGLLPAPTLAARLVPGRRTRSPARRCCRSRATTSSASAADTRFYWMTLLVARRRHVRRARAAREPHRPRARSASARTSGPPRRTASTRAARCCSRSSISGLRHRHGRRAVPDPAAVDQRRACSIPTRGCRCSRWSWSAGSARSAARYSARSTCSARSTSCRARVGLPRHRRRHAARAAPHARRARRRARRRRATARCAGTARRKGIRVPSLLADTPCRRAPTRSTPERRAKRSPRPRPARGRRVRGAARMSVSWRPRAATARCSFSSGSSRCTSPRGPRRYFDEITAGYALFPLVVLFGLNALDELDRTMFGVLAPEHPRPLRPVEPAVPVARRADAARRPAARGPARVLLRPACRACASRCRARPCGRCSASSPARRSRVLDARHRPLRRRHRARGRHADAQLAASPTMYPPEVRAEVFGFHRIGHRASGAIVGRCSAGCSREFFGWRVPFFVFVIPTLVFVYLGLRRQGAGTRPLRARRGRRATPTSSTPTRSRRRSRSRCASCGRSRPCAASGTRCRSSRRRSSASLVLTSIYYEQVFGLGEASARARRRRWPNRRSSSASCSASRSRRA